MALAIARTGSPGRRASRPRPASSSSASRRSPRAARRAPTRFRWSRPRAGARRAGCRAIRLKVGAYRSSRRVPGTGPARRPVVWIGQRRSSEGLHPDQPGAHRPRSGAVLGQPGGRCPAGLGRPAPGLAGAGRRLRSCPAGQGGSRIEPAVGQVNQQVQDVGSGRRGARLRQEILVLDAVPQHRPRPGRAKTVDNRRAAEGAELGA
jgi:hypothetical protein